MQILVLTPIHPMQIAEMVDYLYPRYNGAVELYSIQSMALLAEETLQKEYIPTTYVYAAEIRRNPNLVMNTPYKKRVQIIFGNLDKNTKIKFDHILAFSSHYGENEDQIFDSYLQKSEAAMNAVFAEQNVTPIEWYKQEDAEHTFPTLHHLEKFLDVIGVEKNELQSKSAKSD